jgi:hypothetical protein
LLFQTPTGAADDPPPDPPPTQVELSQFCPTSKTLFAKGLMFHMFSKNRITLALPALLLIAGLIFPASALAHERRTVSGGKYDVIVGWDVEPAYMGLKNAASIRISQAGSNPPVPVTGADATLRVRAAAPGRAASTRPW